MGRDSKIEWCHHTFNPWWGCVKVSEGCAFCYAERHADRFSPSLWGKDGTRRFFGREHWREPLAWDAAAAAAGERHRVFCASMCDVMEDRPELVEPRNRLFELIQLTPNLDWLLLTKRPENYFRFLPKTWTLGMGPNNYWLGTSAENQPTADRRLAELEFAANAFQPSTTFLSAEPLLGSIHLSEAYSRSPVVHPCTRRVDWVIVGGESGPQARALHPTWVRSLRDQCEQLSLKFFFKQWGEYEYDPRQFLTLQHWVNKAQTWLNTESRSILIDTRGRVCRIGADIHRAQKEGCFPLAIARRVGKKAAGRLLDGVLHDEFPQTFPQPLTAKETP